MAPDEALSESSEDHEPGGGKGRFGTFEGVFIPTLLTILGVIMYLRAGWVVGEVGLLGGLIIVTIAFAVTACTGLSLSSITTNIRIGAGGAYSMISQSLGIEMGGSIGVPLYLSQVLATTMYIFGFREGYQWLFPDHPAIVIDFTLFAILAAISIISTGVAFRIQYVIAAIIGVSLVSVGFTVFDVGFTQEFVWWRPSDEGPASSIFLDGHYWTVFAVFFPAATGIMAGANMSGELEDPRRAIPAGTMWAIGLSFVIYMLLAFWLAGTVPAEELRNNYTALIDYAAWGPPVLAGLLGATFSSALASIVGAPRILQALAEHRIVPRGQWLTKLTDKGEPRRAMFVTGVLVAMCLFFRDLNVVAPFITMFFLITYGMINLVVLIEQSLGLVSFRPLFRVHPIIPLVGASGCLFAMFIINATVSLVAVAVVIVFYGLLIRRHLSAPFGDVRSGLFVAIAQWAAQRASDLPTPQERAWRPMLLLPARDSLAVRGSFELIRDIARPAGYVEIMGIAPEPVLASVESGLQRLSEEFRDEEVFSRWTLLEADHFSRGMVLGMEALRGSFFRPNMLFLNLPGSREEATELNLPRVVSKARTNQLGMVLYAVHPRSRLGRRKVINLWIHDRSPDFELALRQSDLDLAILVAYKLVRNWDGHLNIVTAVEDPDDRSDVEEGLKHLVDLARLPGATIHIIEASFEESFEDAPQADLNIIGYDPERDPEYMWNIMRRTQTSCLYVRDSDSESAMA